MQAMTAHTEPLQEKLYQEMVGRIQETDSTVPVRLGNNYYYTRTEAGKQYEIHCRKVGSLDAPDRLAALEGTGLEHLGPKVARKAAMDQAFSEAEFLQGGFTGILQSHNLGTIEVLPSGTFEVAGKQVVITFDSGGEAVFGWSKRDGDTLVLTFVSTTAPSMYGAPAEVFLRMWAAAPFVLQ